MKAKCIILFVVLCGVVNAQYRILHVFGNIHSDGSTPRGSLTLLGEKLYGMTYSGGADNLGCIFSIDSNGNNYKILFNFNNTNGEIPDYTQLLYSEKKLYGMTTGGGANNDGCVFSIDTDGSNYKVIFNFNSTMGKFPQGSLTLSGTKLYGMTYAGGTKDKGCIFSIDTNGNDYKKLLDFNDTNGAYPDGNLTLFNNVLYGMTGDGGKYNIGVIFSLDTNGSNYKKLLDFNNTNGANPFGSLILSGNTLYGMTNREGSHYDYGNIFSIDTNGNNYKNLFGFNGSDGMFPFGSLVLSGNILCGMTAGGPSNFAGTIFSIDTNGNTFNNLFVFDSTDGSFPSGSLILSGNILYGVTSGGALDNNGVIFAFKDTTGSLGINELRATSGVINVYPNPSNGVFTLQAKSEELGGKSIEVYNVLGEKVYSQFNIPIAIGKNPTFNINLSNQPNGVYLYRVITETGELIGSGKVIIAH